MRSKEFIQAESVSRLDSMQAWANMDRSEVRGDSGMFNLMRLLLLTAVITLPCAAGAEEQRLAFKGDPLGMPLDAFKAGHRRIISGEDQEPFCSDSWPRGAFISSPARLPEEVWCTLDSPREMIDRSYTPPTFGGVATLGPLQNHDVAGLLYRFINSDGQQRLWSVDLAVPSSKYSELLAGMTAKFGQPTASATKSLQTLLGAKVEGSVSIWETQSWRVALVEKLGFVDVGGVIYRDKGLETIYLKAKADAVKRAASDM